MQCEARFVDTKRCRPRFDHIAFGVDFDETGSSDLRVQEPERIDQKVVGVFLRTYLKNKMRRSIKHFFLLKNQDLQLYGYICFGSIL